MKRLLSLILCLLLLCAALPASALTPEELSQKLNAAFKDDALKLVETDLSTRRPEATDFEQTDGLPALINRVGDSRNPDVEQELAAILQTAEIQLLSISPTGNSSLYSISDAAVSQYDGKYHIIYPAYDKGVEDTYSNLQTYAEKYFMDRFPHAIGKEGIVYSPDGKYAAVYNIQNSVYKNKFIIDPFIIDLSTGEMILTATYPNNIKEADNSGTVTAARFSADSNTLYYTVYRRFGDNRVQLCRYDIPSGKTETMLETDPFAWQPPLFQTAAGNFLILINNPEKTEAGLGWIKNTDGSWTLDQMFPYSTPSHQFMTDKLLYSANSGYAVLTGKTSAGYTYAFQLIKPDEDLNGFDQYLSIAKDTNEIITATAEEYYYTIAESMKPLAENEQYKMDDPNPYYPYQTIQNMVLSPDGHYVLVFTSAQSIDSESRNLYLIRLDDLAVREISGLDANEILFGPMTKHYPIVIEWNAEDLIIGTNDGVRTFRFDY